MSSVFIGKQSEVVARTPTGEELFYALYSPITHPASYVLVFLGWAQSAFAPYHGVPPSTPNRVVAAEPRNDRSTDLATPRFTK